ncbi:MAG: fasciclin domain-containing protein [Bacteroidales bacterium]|nr:fasciclin domain-containing protein [Bacteroidales bacterium]
MKKICLQILLIPLLFSCGEINQSETQSTTYEEEKTSLGQAGVQDEVSDKNILQIATGSKDHTTLVAAVQAAQIENVLANNGPITVFAPNNDAFVALPAGTVEELLKPENKKKLANIITNHAAPGTYKGKLLKDGSKLYMATGNYLDVKVVDNNVFVGGAKILATIDASNGVIHVVDKVLIPEEK